MGSKIIEWNEAWKCMDEHEIMKVKRILEEQLKPPFTTRNYTLLYSTIYNMCTLTLPRDNYKRLYDGYHDALEDYITSMVLPSLEEEQDEFLLRELVRRWSNHKVMVKWVSRFIPYLDKYIVGRRSLPAFSEVGLAFRDLVYQGVKANVRDAVITLIDKEREGERIDRALLKDVIDIFIDMGMGEMDLYEQDFEAQMLQSSGAYYSRKASIWIMHDSFLEYVLKAEECLRRERDRVSHYLHISSEQKLVEKVQHELLVVHATQLLEKEDSQCHALLRDDKVEDLSRICRLYLGIPKGLDLVSIIFKRHVTAKGTALVQQANDGISSETANQADVQEQVDLLFRKIIELHNKYMEYVKNCFMNHSLFHEALNEAFKVFCNETVAGISSAELLATFCDNILKKGRGEKLSDDDIKETLEKVVKLLAYISDKDLFEKFYQEKLARRLLFDQSANEDYEKFIHTKLKQHCSAQFTWNIESMGKDLTLARENQNNFEEYLHNTDVNLGIDLTVRVLNPRLWPSYKSFHLRLPPEMVKCVEVFKEFYETRRFSKTEPPKKLTWIYSLGTCNINGKFDAKTIELIVSTSQAAVLLLFDNADKLNYLEIKSQLNLSDDDFLIRLLRSLSCGKYKILYRSPSKGAILPTDNFVFNSKFTNEKERIVISLPPVDERTMVQDERARVVQDVCKDRQYALDAAIVRIMKSRKVSSHQQLVKECVQQLSHMFKPESRSIKKRIEDLIAREYLERDKENRNFYKYLTE